MKKLMLSTLAAISLMGCADHIVEPRGTTITLQPTEFSFSVQSNDTAFALKKLNEFTQKYRIQSGSQWVITSYSHQGHELSKQYRDVLAKRGVESANVSLVKVEHASRFDVQVSVVQLKPELEICHQEKVGQYGHGHLGCYTDGSRWQSMVNPQRAL